MKVILRSVHHVATVRAEYNKFFIEELAWTGEQIGAARPWGMWAGGVIGLLVGVAVSLYGSRYLLLGFVFLELLLYLLLGTADVELIASNGFLILLGVDIAVVGSQVIMFALLMSLCVTRTSATSGFNIWGFIQGGGVGIAYGLYMSLLLT